MLIPLFFSTLSGAAAAELPTPALSPRAEVMQTIGVAKVRVSYSSPGKKDRTIWGELVPYGELWRTGANAATTFSTDQDLTVGGKPLPAGSYAVYTIPGESEWTVIFNTDTRSTTGSYDEALDQARFTVAPAEGPGRERLTFLFSDTDASSADLTLEWDGVAVSVPIEVATGSIIASSIDAYRDAASRDLTGAARYLQRTGDDAGALALIDAALAVERTWLNVWVKASLLHDAGENREAKRLAQEALELGNASEGFFYKSQVEKAAAEWPKR